MSLVYQFWGGSTIQPFFIEENLCYNEFVDKKTSNLSIVIYYPLGFIIYSALAVDIVKFYGENLDLKHNFPLYLISFTGVLILVVVHLLFKINESIKNKKNTTKAYVFSLSVLLVGTIIIVLSAIYTFHNVFVPMHTTNHVRIPSLY